MVSRPELKARLNDYFRFSRQELSGLAAAVIVLGLIFSFRDWGEEVFDLAIGLQHLVTIIIIIIFSLLFRLSCQKIYALSEGYKAEFKVWLIGLGISFIIVLLSLGRVPAALVGGMVVSFMIKQRLGEFRYGFSYWNNAMISYWGILGNLIAAILFALGAYFAPESYFFTKGILFNLAMATSILIPLPQLEGLQIFFGSRKLYGIALLSVILAWVLLWLLAGTKFGLITAIVIGSLTGIIYLLIGSEK